jgi:hypothetical protein
VREAVDTLKSNEILLDVEAPPNEEYESKERSNTRLLEEAHGEKYGFAALFLSYFPLKEQHEKEDREREECGDMRLAICMRGGKEPSVWTEEILHSSDRND